MIQIKTIISYLLITIFGLAAVSCGSSTKDEPEPEQTTPRTVLVYMVANNTLGDSSFDTNDLKEMEAASGDLGRSRWIVYHHDSKGNIELKELTTTGWNVLKTYTNEVKSTSSTRMSEVIRDVKAVAPAENYGLVLWSHASGWIVDGKEDLVARAGATVTPLSFGDDRGGRMNLATLRRVLTDQDFDYIYTDCCNMSTIEVAYELRDVTQFLIGSATELPADGMPYDKNLKLLAAEDPDVVGAARNTYNYYVDRNYSDDWCTISVINLDEIEDLAGMTAAIYALHPTYDASFTPQALGKSPCYYYDFKDFVDYIASEQEKEVWNLQLKKAVIYEAHMPRFDYIKINHHCGLATFIYTPTRPASTHGYDQSQWYKDVAVIQPTPVSIK